MLRDQLIQLLVIDALEHAGDAGRYRWLERILERGWRGFSSMNDRELMEEARRRGIEEVNTSAERADNNGAMDDTTDDTSDDYDSELPQLISAYATTTQGLDFI